MYRLVNCRPETVKDLSKVPQLEVVVLEFEPRQWGPGLCAINHQSVQRPKGGGTETAGGRDGAGQPAAPVPPALTHPVRPANSAGVPAAQFPGTQELETASGP